MTIIRKNESEAVIQIGTSWDELPQEIKDYYAEHASDENPIPFDAKTIEEIAKKLNI